MQYKPKESNGLYVKSLLFHFLSTALAARSVVAAASVVVEMLFMNSGAMGQDTSSDVR